MIDWHEHSTATERVSLSKKVDEATAAVFAAKRDVLNVQAKMVRLKKPSSILAATEEFAKAEHQATVTEAAHAALIREMCNLHLAIAPDDLVELADDKGGRKREPIVIETIEFNRGRQGEFWLRFQGVLLQESETGRPQIRQGFDLREFDAGTRIVKHS